MTQGYLLDTNIPSELSRPIPDARLQGSCASAGEYPEAIRLMANGAITVKPLISAVSSLDEAASWFKRLHAREAGLLKVVVTPGKLAA